MYLLQNYVFLRGNIICNSIAFQTKVHPWDVTVLDDTLATSHLLKASPENASLNKKLQNCLISANRRSGVCFFTELGSIGDWQLSAWKQLPPAENFNHIAEAQLPFPSTAPVFLSLRPKVTFIFGASSFFSIIASSNDFKSWTGVATLPITPLPRQAIEGGTTKMGDTGQVWDLSACRWAPLCTRNWAGLPRQPDSKQPHKQTLWIC